MLQVHGNTGMSLATWTGAASGVSVLVAAGKVYVAGATSPGSVYVIDPTQSQGRLAVATKSAGVNPYGIAFDGTNIWTANFGPPARCRSLRRKRLIPYHGTTVTGFMQPYGILYDGVHIWVTDNSAGTLLKLDAVGNIVQTVTVGMKPANPVFDGATSGCPTRRQYDHRGPGQYRQRGGHDRRGCQLTS